jgi:acetyl esterase
MPAQRNTTKFIRYEDALAHVIQAGYTPANPMTQSLLEARGAQHRYLSFLALESPKTGHLQEFSIAGPNGPIRLRVLYPLQSSGTTPIIYLRGGGWWAGSLDTSARTMALLCNASGLPVVGIDYRLTPEYRFPSQLQEVAACLRWLVAQASSINLDPDNILIWGESAGATLAVGASRALQQTAGVTVQGLLLFYGNFSGPGAHASDYSNWVWRQYLGSEPSVATDHPVVLKGSLARLPPVWMGVGDADPLQRDTHAMAQGLAAESVPHVVKVYAGMPHGFLAMSRLLTIANDAIIDAAQEARRLATGSGQGVGSMEQR